MSSFEYQWAMWPPQRDQRTSLRDVLSTPREVEHFAYFKRRANAVRAAEELTTDGYAVTLVKRGLKTLLQAVRNDSLEDETVSQFLRGVIEVVERNRGDNDGWGAPVAESVRD